MGNFNDKLKKNKEKVAIIISILLIVGIITGVYFITKKNNSDAHQLIDKNYRLADYIVTGNDIGFVRLLRTKDGKDLSNIDLKKGTDSRYTYSRGKDLDSVYVYGTLENSFYKVTMDKDKLDSKVMVKAKDIIDFDTFKADGNYVVTLSKDKKILNKISKDGTAKEFKIAEEINDYLITDNTLIYTTTNHIHRINLINDETNKIEIGDKTVGLFSVKGNIIAFNRFGSGKKQSIALKINPKDLYIKNMQKFDSVNIEPITPDSDDEKLSYTEVINADTNPIQSMTILNQKNINKETANIKLQTKISEIKYTKENSIASKGYMYTHKGNKLEIMDIRSEQLAHTIDVGEIFVTPIIK